METLGINAAHLRWEVGSPVGSRRRRARHRAHTPAFAVLNGSCTGHDLELNEILNISEDGLALQCSAPLGLDETLQLCLDLSETGARIETSCRVIWRNEGKVGFCFPAMPLAVRRQLQEWLFINAVMACADQPSQLAASPDPEILPEAQPVDAQAATDTGAFPADYTDTLTALSAVSREAKALGADLDGALQLIAERALTFLRGNGAAIALVNGSEMTCRATAGAPAPGLGASLQIGKGFSGECLRTGKALRCQDTETDPLTDKESCRAMGIRSMIAVPVQWRESTIGLLEVFSVRPDVFRSSDEAVLARLAEMIGWSVHRASSEPSALSDAAAVADYDEVSSESPIETNFARLSVARKVLLVATTVTLMIAIIWLAQPWNPLVGSVALSAPPPGGFVSPRSPVPGPRDFEGIHKLAEQGDAAAQFAVGAHYATGEDVPQDYAEAVRWFTLAAEQGHVGAQATLGAYYWSGRGVPVDLVRAYLWAVLAQTGGDDASKYRVAFLTSRMTRSQVLEAQQEANEWIKAHESNSNASASQPK
jgi:GAF domain-containing protein